MLDNLGLPVVLALGYFDSVHKGHIKVINKACAKAKELNAKTVVFTFSGNLRAFFKGEKEKFVYTPKERKEILLSLGADEVYFAPVNKTFLSKGKRAFLNYINSKFNVCAYVCGSDYTFGKNASGSVKFLEEYAKAKEQTLVRVPVLNMAGEKVSTSRIKERLISGDVKGANALLGRDYSLSGKVFKDRKVGTALGFPTANIKADKNKQTLKNGVYSGYAFVHGKKYKAVINYGARPTFSLSDVLIEAHLIDFSGNLYGKTLAVYFSDFIRDVKTFSSREELKKQIEKDVTKAKKG